jgi:hypothetical protein
MHTQKQSNNKWSENTKFSKKQKLKSEAINRRKTDNTIAKRKRSKGQTMI